MNQLFILFLTALMVVGTSCSHKEPESLVLVNGGTFKNTKSNFYDHTINIPSYFIGRYEVTQKEWIEIMTTNPSQFKGDNLPVETVSWYDCIEYCNKRSIKEGFKPYYQINKNQKDLNNNNDFDDLKWTVTINHDANGYRLPTEMEWEYAAGGGQMSKSFTFSGSNQIDEVAWYWKNSGDKYLTGNWSWPTLVDNKNKTQPIGGKKPNELGLYNMSGNVREWCWDWHASNSAEDTPGRIWKGGGWIGADFCCENAFRIAHEATGKGPDQGFRVCRNQ